MQTAAPNKHSTAMNRPGDNELSWWVDLLLLGVLAALAVGLFDFGIEVFKPSEPLRSTPIEMDLSLSSLPFYALLSLLRGFAAYVLSLLFTLIYGAIAAKSHRAERLMIPVLDILQGIPVLSFLPGLVLGMVAIFPHSNIGLELACVIMIFTGQAWNMAFAFYGSVRGVPTEMREVAQIYRLGWWKTFRALEVPFSAVPLVWNSMMSMAGGWFFLTVNEAFRLGDRDFRLPGIGSYMSVAIDKGDTKAMIGAVVAMGLMILATDQLLWQPLVAWTNRFKFEEIGGQENSSWVLDLLRRSEVLHHVGTWMHGFRQKAAERRKAADVEAAFDVKGVSLRNARTQAFAGFLYVGLALVVGWGAWTLVELVGRLTLAQWGGLIGSLGLTFLRTFVCVLLGAVWCIPVGIMIGRSPKWSLRLQPIVQLLASFPAPMVFPLVTMALLAAGVDFSYGCVALMMLGSMWYILFNVIAAAKSIPHDMIEAANVYGVEGVDRWRTLFLPAVFPALVTGLITAAGGAWNASIVSEFVKYQGKELVAPGLGSTIFKATDAGDFGLLAAATMVMSAALVLINRLFWKRLYRIADQRFALNR